MAEKQDDILGQFNCLSAAEQAREGQSDRRFGVGALVGVTVGALILAGACKLTQIDPVPEWLKFDTGWSPRASAAPVPGPTITPRATEITPTIPMYTGSPSASPTESPSPTVQTAAPSETPPAVNAQEQQVIFLDPGHSGKSQTVIDPETGIEDKSYMNDPEIYEMYDVSVMVRDELKAAGYTVVLWKNNALDSKTHRERAEAARAAGAAIMVSIHDDHSTDSYQAVYDQRDGQYRVSSNGEKVIFRDAVTACISNAYAKNVVAARSAAQGKKVTLSQLDFGGRDLAGGNAALVMLFTQESKDASDQQVKAGIPAVYNEMSAKQGNDESERVPEADLKAYAHGIAQGVIMSMQQQASILQECGAANN